MSTRITTSNGRTVVIYRHGDETGSEHDGGAHVSIDDAAGVIANANLTGEQWAQVVKEQGPDTDPQFAPDGVGDRYRTQWESVDAREWEASALQLAAGAEHTQWLDVTAKQARHILAYLSEDNRKIASI